MKARWPRHCQSAATGGMLLEQEAFRRPLDGARGKLSRQHAPIARAVAVGNAVDHRIAGAGDGDETVFIGLRMTELLPLRERFEKHDPAIWWEKSRSRSSATASASRLIRRWPCATRQAPRRRRRNRWRLDVDQRRSARLGGRPDGATSIRTERPRYPWRAFPAWT